MGAAATQWMILMFVGRPARLGGLGLASLLWASLYALAAGAAAFAGERETGTLRLLDNLAVDRSVVWKGKVSFALVTTLALTFLLLVMAAISTDRWNPQHPLTPYHFACLCMFVLVALGWALFCSSVFETALGACVAALCFSGLTLIAVAGGITAILDGKAAATTSMLGPIEFSVMIATMVASQAFFVLRGPRKRIEFQFQSPIVVSRSASLTSRRAHVGTPDVTVPAPAARPMAAGIMPGAAPASRRPRWIEARTLVSQTVKESRQTWFFLTAFAIVVTAMSYALEAWSLDPLWLTIIALVGFLTAGVNVFGLENRARSYRFLVHHGARPGLVWAIKLATWIGALAVFALAVGGVGIATSRK